MSRSALALAFTVILLTTASVPASAASWFQLRINPSNATAAQDPITDDTTTYPIYMFGATGFLQIPNSRFGFRFNVDWGAFSTYACGDEPCDPENAANPSSWRWYDLSLGLPITFGRVQTLFFLGYGATDWSLLRASERVFQHTTNGWVLGTDVWVPFGSSGRWYLAGNVTLGPQHQYKFFEENMSLPDQSGRADVANYSIAIGWSPPNSTASIELGWRTGGFKVTSITGSMFGDTDAVGLDQRWSGAYLGLMWRR